MPFRRLLKDLLPHGLVELRRDLGRLRELGLSLPPSRWLAARRLLADLDETGLALLPPGHLRDLSCVVDVGANVGHWSAAVLRSLAPQRLIAIEPAPGPFAQLRERLGDRAELHQVAVGAETGQAALHLTRDSTGASLLPPAPAMREVVGRNWSVEEKISVPVRTLDDLLREVAEISLLKLDVQGVEHEVLAGAREVLRRTRFLLIEMNFMRQYEGGSWFGPVHETLTESESFVLVNVSPPLCLNGRASMCDGLYVNRELIPEWVKPDFT